MRRSNSFISNSDLPVARRTRRARYRIRVLAVSLWTAAALVGLDVSIDHIFRMPADPRDRPSPLQAYFDYGRSIEGKLRYEIGASADRASPVVNAGWLGQECDKPTRASEGRRTLDVYGMSFSNQIADQMAALDPRLAIQNFGGPAAPLNHSYACFTRRVLAGRALASVQIVGVLASSVNRILTISGLTTSFEAPQPFTYPRYSLGSGGRLTAYSASIATAEDLRAALDDRVDWQSFVAELAAHDAYYTPATMSADILDRSVLGRLARRALAQRFIRERTSALTEDGELGGSNAAALLSAMLLDFSEKTRATGSRPFVILIEDRGYGGALSVMLAPSLDGAGIEYLATTAIASSSDASNFLPDGHFKPEINRQIAARVLQILYGASP